MTIWDNVLFFLKGLRPLVVLSLSGFYGFLAWTINVSVVGIPGGPLGGSLSNISAHLALLSLPPCFLPTKPLSLIMVCFVRLILVILNTFH